MNVFEAVKQSVTTRQAAEHYGIRVNRNGMACCPFHNDKTPSMKLDKRFHEPGMKRFLRGVRGIVGFPYP